MVVATYAVATEHVSRLRDAVPSLATGILTNPSLRPRSIAIAPRGLEAFPLTKFATATRPRLIVRADRGPQALSVATDLLQAARGIAVTTRLLQATAVTGLLAVTVATQGHQAAAPARLACLLHATTLARVLAVAVTGLSHLSGAAVGPLLPAITTANRGPRAPMSIEANPRPQAATAACPSEAVTIATGLGPRVVWRGPPALPMGRETTQVVAMNCLVLARSRRMSVVAVQRVTITAHQSDMHRPTWKRGVAFGRIAYSMLFPLPSMATKKNLVNSRPQPFAVAKLCYIILRRRRRKATELK